jgi:capsular polysaccharide biosynthesis protein
MAAIRRRSRLWCLAAAAGLILGAGLYVVRPPAYTAVTEAYLTLGPNQDPTTAIATDVAVAQSQPTAVLALKKLGLRESFSTLLGSYTAAPVTNLVIEIALKARTSDQAVRNANGVMAAFLQVRAAQLQQYQRLLSSSFDIGVAKARSRVAAIARQVGALTGNAASPGQTAKLSDLQAQLRQARDTVATLEQSAQAAQQSAQAATDLAVSDSYVFATATPVAKSRKKTLALYALTGLAGGLFAGLGIIVVQALVSERLRWRDDIARALGAPVRLSVGRVRRPRLPGRGRLAAMSSPDVQRIARHLDGLVGDRAGAALAVVAADRPDSSALAIVALALSRARLGRRVVLADLWPGAPAARLLGARHPGVHQVQVPDARLIVAIPEHGDIAPTGPLTRAAAQPRRVLSGSAPAGGDLAAAYSSGDVLLTLAHVDPMLGAEHLATWAADVVVVVTAGQSTWTRAQAISEMIRLAGARLTSAVLIGADKTDESSGLARQTGADHDVGATQNGSHADGSRLFATPPDAG